MWIDFNDSFTVVTMKFLYINMELNLPHHLNYVAALPCKCTQRIVHVKNDWHWLWDFLAHSRTRRPTYFDTVSNTFWHLTVSCRSSHIQPAESRHAFSSNCSIIPPVHSILLLGLLNYCTPRVLYYWHDGHDGAIPRNVYMTWLHVTWRYEMNKLIDDLQQVDQVSQKVLNIFKVNESIRAKFFVATVKSTAASQKVAVD